MDHGSIGEPTEKCKTAFSSADGNQPFAELPYASLRPGIFGYCPEIHWGLRWTVFSPKMHEHLKPYLVGLRVFSRRAGIPRIFC